MRLGHHAALRPLCLRCRHQRDTPVLLGPPIVEEQHGDDVIAGMLPCPVCSAAYPIWNGIPILVADLPQLLRTQSHALFGCPDLPPKLSNFLHERLGMDSPWTERRAVMSAYAISHWGDRLVGQSLPAPVGPGCESMLAVWKALSQSAAMRGPLLDGGCAAGRITLEAAARVQGPCLGVDLNLDLLRLAAARARGRTVEVDVLRNGLASERRTIRGEGEQPQVDLWCADVSDLPFAARTFGTVVSMQTLDSVADPGGLLGEAARVLQDEGEFLLSSPFDWHAHVTPEPGWIGGFGGASGDPVVALRELLERTGLLTLEEAWDELPWVLRQSDRLATVRTVWAARLRRLAVP